MATPWAHEAAGFAGPASACAAGSDDVAVQSASVFVLLQHDAPAGRHWDFMIEMPGATKLATWRLAVNPLTAAGRAIAVEPIGDHRRDYLEYEGEVSGGRGTVRRLDRGECRILKQSVRFLELELNGQHLHGRYRLSRLASPDGFRPSTPARPAGE